MTVSTRRTVRRTLFLVAVVAVSAASVALADHGGGHAIQDATRDSTATKAARLGLDGYCPVCVVEARKWERGRPEFQSTYDGVTYYFPNAQIKNKFDATPAKYVPALGGDCTVCYAKAGKRVPGSIQHAALSNNRLFLFPSEKEKQVFQQQPEAYANVDLAANGECIVCLVKANKHVPGSSDHTVFHNGFRYLFPSDREASAFVATPEKFVSAVTKPNGRATSMNGRTSAKIVSVSGMSACAGCEFGVAPLANPDELGLAIKVGNGRVVVVENAHKLYPEIYAARYDGQQLRVEGSILKTEGKVAWLQPSSVRVLN